MLIIEYTKKFPVSAISHKDLIKVFQRIIRRAKIDVEYSQGFNPHMKIVFSPPIPLGMESTSEYVAIATPTVYEKDFLATFNAVCPQGIVATNLYNFSKNPNLAKIITRAEYNVNAKDIGNINFGQALNNDQYVIECVDKQNLLQTQVVVEMIFDAKRIDDDNLSVVLAFGNKNLRAELLIKYWCKNNGIDFDGCKITKTNAFADEINVVEFLRNFK